MFAKLFKMSKTKVTITKKKKKMYAIKNMIKMSECNKLADSFSIESMNAEILENNFIFIETEFESSMPTF